MRSGTLGRVGALVVVEGLDGAGKATLTRVLRTALEARGARVDAVAFPRYGTPAADLVADALHGRAGDLGASVHGMAALFALDRHAAAPDLRERLARHDVVLCDRWTASNAAFGAARLHQDAAGELVEWVRALEVERLGLPVPAVQLLLAVPVAVAAARAVSRAAGDATRARDAFERDDGLQARTAAVYAGLAAAGWVSPWRTLDGGPDGGADPVRTAAALAADLLAG